MKLKVCRSGFVIAGALALATLLPQAHASTIFTLTVNGCSGTGGCGAGPFGTVTLEQTTATLVTVTETLAANERFAGSGAGDALEFNVAGPITLGNISSGFAIGPAPDTASTFGTFFASITCTACSGGQAGNSPGPLSFTVTSATGVTIADFVANASGFYFASDIVGANGNTGNVGANSFVNQLPPPPSTPEPVSVSLVGAGIAGLCWFKARRSKSSV